MDIYEELVQVATGQTPLMHTQTCVERDLQYGDKKCPGCPSNLACSKSVALEGISIGASLAGLPPDKTRLLFDRVLAARTHEEICQVPWPEIPRKN